MRRRLLELLAKGRAKLNEPAVQQTIRLAAVAAGFGALKQLLEDYAKRLEALEDRGLVPLDDLATVGDLAKIDRRVWVLEGEPGSDPAAAILPPEESPHDQPCPHGDDVGCCLVCTPLTEEAEEAAPPPDL